MNTKQILDNAIKFVVEHRKDSVVNPYKDFIRERIFGFRKTITFVIDLNKDSLKKQH